jgi:hypothetical protein
MSVERIQASQLTSAVYGKDAVFGKTDRNPQRNPPRRPKRTERSDPNAFLNALGQAVGTRLHVVA